MAAELATPGSERQIRLAEQLQQSPAVTAQIEATRRTLRNLADIDNDASPSTRLRQVAEAISQETEDASEPAVFGSMLYEDSEVDSFGSAGVWGGEDGEEEALLAAQEVDQQAAEAAARCAIGHTMQQHGRPVNRGAI